jgi:hypothetical protein
VWPDQPERAARLSAALDTAVRVPVPVYSGDLIEQLPDVLEKAPRDATLAERTEPTPATSRKLRTASHTYDVAIDDLLNRAGLAV